MPTFLFNFSISGLLLGVVWAPASLCAADNVGDPYKKYFFGAQVLSLSQANLAIGVTADAIAKKVYEGENAVMIATVHSRLLEAMKTVLLDIAKDRNVDEADAALLKKMANVVGRLKEQADTVIGLAKGESGENFARSRADCEKALAAMATEIKEHFK